MTRFRRLAILLVGLIFAMAGVATTWLVAASAATPSVALAPPSPQPNGVNFTIHSHLDPNFCVQDVPAPSVPASEASMTQCEPLDNQHWTFADAADGSVVLIGGSQGECLDFAAKAPSYVSLVPCTFKNPESFYYDGTTGLIESTSGKLCLQTTAAAQNAEILIEKCNAAVPLQIWTIGH
jgi:hypothetical protein